MAQAGEMSAWMEEITWTNCQKCNQDDYLQSNADIPLPPYGENEPDKGAATHSATSSNSARVVASYNYGE